MKPSVATNFSQISRQLDALQRGVQKASASALNKTVAQARTVMAREMQKQLDVPAAKIAKVLRIDRARAQGGRLSLRAILEVRARTGMDLQPGQAAPQARSPVLNRRIVQARKRAKGRSVGSRRLPLGTALARGGAARSIHSAKGRLPGKASLRAEVARLFNDKRINAKTLSAIRAKVPAIFEREMHQHVDGFNNGTTPRRRATPGLGSFLRKFFARVG